MPIAACRFYMQYYEGAISELKRICASYNVDPWNSFNTLETNLEKFEKVREYKIISYSLEERNYFKREFSDLRKLGHEKIKDPRDRLGFLQCVRVIEQSVTSKQNVNSKIIETNACRKICFGYILIVKLLQK